VQITIYNKAREIAEWETVSVCIKSRYDYTYTTYIIVGAYLIVLSS